MWTEASRCQSEDESLRWAGLVMLTHRCAATTISMHTWSSTVSLYDTIPSLEFELRTAGDNLGMGLRWEGRLNLRAQVGDPPLRQYKSPSRCNDISMPGMIIWSGYVSRISVTRTCTCMAGMWCGRWAVWEMRQTSSADRRLWRRAS